jgi:hypothetical protein
MQNNYICLDSLVAELNILTTNFLLNSKRCQTEADTIVQQLNQICIHDELCFFPEQQKVYLNMLKVWKLIACKKQMEPSQISDEQVIH